MSSVPDELWPWFAIAALGLFHGVNPAMGWLFAVALGLHRHARTVVLMSLVPIAVGHAVAVALVLVAVLALGLIVDPAALKPAAGITLIGWAFWHALSGRRHRVQVGMQTGLAGLALWSFLMASAHGAGLMLVPAVLPLCLAATPAHELTASGSTAVALGVLAVHTGTMLATIAVISVLVYDWVGVAFLRRGWINLDLIWIGALVVSGIILLST